MAEFHSRDEVQRIKRDTIQSEQEYEAAAHLAMSNMYVAETALFTQRFRETDAIRADPALGPEEKHELVLDVEIAFDEANEKLLQRHRKVLIEMGAVDERNYQRQMERLEEDLEYGFIDIDKFDRVSAALQLGRTQLVLAKANTMGSIFNDRTVYLTALIDKYNRGGRVCAGSKVYLKFICQFRVDCVLDEEIESYRVVPCSSRYEIIELGYSWFNTNPYEPDKKPEFTYAHANAVIVDRGLGEYEVFEPNGGAELDWTPQLNAFLNGPKFRALFRLGSFKFVPASDFCPRRGFQELLAGTPFAGTCALWSLWYMQQRILYPELSREQIIQRNAQMTEREALGMMVAMARDMNNLGLNISPMQKEAQGRAPYLNPEKYRREQEEEKRKRRGRTFIPPSGLRPPPGLKPSRYSR